MSSRAKKNYVAKLKNKRLELELEKLENQKIKNKSVHTYMPVTQNAEQPILPKKAKITQETLSQLHSTPMKQTENLKSLGFWSKKLQDLESFSVEKKQTKLGLYEFIASEDSFLPKKRYIKSKKNNNKNNKKHVEFPVITKNSENLKCKNKHLLKEFKNNLRKKTSNKKVFENKENNGKELKNKIKLAPQMPSEFLTSTPASNKTKSLCTSNFIFLSPIKMTKFEKFSNQNVKNNADSETHNITPKGSNEILNNKEEIISFRVLRNRKILIKN